MSESNRRNPDHGWEDKIIYWAYRSSSFKKSLPPTKKILIRRFIFYRALNWCYPGTNIQKFLYRRPVVFVIDVPLAWRFRRLLNIRYVG